MGCVLIPAYLPVYFVTFRNMLKIFIINLQSGIFQKGLNKVYFHFLCLLLYFAYIQGFVYHLLLRYMHCFILVIIPKSGREYIAKKKKKE